MIYTTFKEVKSLTVLQAHILQHSERTQTHLALFKCDISQINELSGRTKHQQRASGRVILVETLNPVQISYTLHKLSSFLAF